MRLDQFNKFLEGNFSSGKLEELKEILDSEKGSSFIDHLFDSFELEDCDADDADLRYRLLEKIRSKIKVEELITEISEEHKRQERILDKSRDSIRRRPVRKKFRNLLFLGSFFVLLSVGFWLQKTGSFVPQEKAKPISYINKSTGKGQKLTLHLSDGSKVVLNSRSKIKYPESFSDSVRQVYVEGEVFFEVAHNAKKPFVVHAGHLTSKVLGTSFNVRYRPEENINAVALVTGKVQVSIKQQRDQSSQSYVLTPGESMELNSTEGIFQKQNFNIEREIGWKDNIIFFKDANYDEVFETLENWYGVEIDFRGCSKDTAWKLTARFENENLENILNALSLSQGIHYDLNEKNVSIKF